MLKFWLGLRAGGGVSANTNSLEATSNNRGSKFAEQPDLLASLAGLSGQMMNKNVKTGLKLEETIYA
jgi:hypothetical protein